MRPNRLERLTQRGAVATLLLVIHGLGVPQSAWAGCNHLVSSHSDRLLNIYALDELITGRNSAMLSNGLQSAPTHDRGSKRPTPCSGPGCSSRDPMSVPTGVPFPVDTDQWGALSVPVVVTPPSPFDRLTDAPDPGSSLQGSSIFRPPRA